MNIEEANKIYLDRLVELEKLLSSEYSAKQIITKVPYFEPYG